MSKGIGWALGAVVLIVLCAWAYRNKASGAASMAGEVVSLDSKGSTTSSDGRSNIDPSPSLEPTPATPIQPAPAPTSADLQPRNGTAPLPPAVPSSDTLSPSAPNGMAFGGKGRFQWYRQGNLTWRIDTVSGATCINFATLDEWSKPIVYTHACQAS